MVENVVLVVAAARYRGGVAPGPRAVRSVGRGVVEAPLELPRETVLRARPVRNVTPSRAPIIERRALAADAPAAGRATALPRQVAEAYRPAPLDASGALLDLYV